MLMMATGLGDIKLNSRIEGSKRWRIHPKVYAWGCRFWKQAARTSAQHNQYLRPIRIIVAKQPLSSESGWPGRHGMPNLNIGKSLIFQF